MPSPSINGNNSNYKISYNLVELIYVKHFEYYLALNKILFVILSEESLRPGYAPQEDKWALSQEGNKKGLWWYLENKLSHPQGTQKKAMKTLHDPFHMGREATLKTVTQVFTGLRRDAKLAHSVFTAAPVSPNHLLY